jgi:hypothetical protein
VEKITEFPLFGWPIKIFSQFAKRIPFLPEMVYTNGSKTSLRANAEKDAA